MEEYDCRSTICRSPAARRVGRMGERAKRRSERCILFTYAERIQSLRTRTVDNAVPGGRCALRSGAYVQAHAGNRPDCPFRFGLLAASPFLVDLLHNGEVNN